jgi:hypothetical protein
MNPQVQRLEELLTRIERNRRSPKKNWAGTMVNVTQTTTERAPAIEEYHSARPSEPTVVAPIQVPSPPVRPQAPAREEKASALRPVPIPPASVIRPAQAIAKVVGELPKTEEPSFGQLLRRSLALRPS